MSVKKNQLLDKDILTGDNVQAKLTIKKKKQKIISTIKWKGEGKFFGEGIWYRVDTNDGKRHFFQKDAIVKNFSLKARSYNHTIEKRAKNEKGNKKKKKKIKKTKWINIHFVGCPDITKKNKQFKMHMSLAQSSTFEVAEFKDEKKEEIDSKYDNELDDEKLTEMDDLILSDIGAIGAIGGMQDMGRGRSQSQPKPQIQHKKNKLSVNEIYSLKGVESRSIRIHINPNKFKVSELKSYITAKFKIPPTSKLLLMYNNCTLTNQNASISYYGIENHSCLLLCISEPPSKKKPIKPKPASRRSNNRNINRTRTRNNSAVPTVRNSSNRRNRIRASSTLPNGRNNNNNNNNGGISGIDNNSSPKPNNLAPPKSTSISDNVGINNILKDKSKPLRQRINKFCKQFEIKRMTDLDIYTFDIDHNCIQMQCGHGMPKESLFAYAEAQFKDGKKALKCPHLKKKNGTKLCKNTWNFQVVRKILLSGASPRIDLDDIKINVATLENSLFGLVTLGYLRSELTETDISMSLFSMDIIVKIYQYCLDKKCEAILRRPQIKRMMGLEIECAKNKFIDTYDYQKCPNCLLFIYRKQVSIDKVKCFCLCPLCEGKFCWLCANSWKTRDKAQHCGNNECTVSWTKQHLGILQKCKTKQIGRVSGIPEVRACPKCNELIFHVTACKHMNCRSCKTQFCFCCLKLYRPGKGGWQCGSSGAVCPVAPRQKTNALSNTNRGNVELFKLLY